MELLRRAGVPVREVLWAVTKAEWEACLRGGAKIGDYLGGGRWEVGVGAAADVCGVGCGLEEG